MEFLQLKYFQAVARHEHITKAAKELNVSQPSLSNSINRLEKRLGVPLFERQGRHVKLNAFGKTYLRRVERAFLELEEGEREITDMAGLEHGTVSISVTLPYVLPMMLKEFLTLHPHIRIIQRQLGSVLEMRSELENADIDFCISTTQINGPDIEWLTLAEEELCLTVPKGHRFASRESISLIEAEDEPFIALSSRSNFREITDGFCRKAGFEPHVAFELEEVSSIQTLVEMGLGITFTLPLSLGNRASSPGTVQLKITDPTCRRTFGIAWNRKHYLSQAAVHFRDFAISFFGKL
ncbi:DNA-binding transcriptional regulator, LysR family [Paenibacillus catalpae]|uniref:DNA-binding transcriptional regulator, LysR family n=1 Tax=Paenibacillus catalpae TaxID=1045775 RepID=A0A1I2E715_9BACL|nr:LysR family transcriptional regulator [Paenibacillus catalpae]SFE88732.1 DNA-binding transcriptional regulator, LysR family [Paenibacillus catalpae]